MTKISFHSKKYVFIQGRIPTDVFYRAKSFMEKQQLKWPEFLTAVICHFLDEQEKEKKLSL